MKKNKTIFLILILSIIHNCYSQQQVIGVFDVAHPEQGCQGWALDPDNPNASITIHFYANKPAGRPGSVFIGSTVADISRPDVNIATGYPGNHGFNWELPTHLTTPCQILIFAYGIDLNGNGNPNLSNSPKLMPILTKSISQSVGNHLLTISANSQFAGAINSLTWKGKEFINSDDHGRLLQSAVSLYDQSYSWDPECYNPTEAGNHGDTSGSCTSSELLNLSNTNGILHSNTQMAFYSNSSNQSPGCKIPSSIPQNQTTVLSNHIMEKNVSINVPNIPHAIKYDVKYTIPYDETNLYLGQFEVVTGYLNAEFNTIFRYDQIQDILIPTNNQPNGEDGKPVVISTSDGLYAMGIYSPEIPIYTTPFNSGYGQFQFPTVTYKWNFVRRISNLIPGQEYSFNSYICVGSLAEVKVTLSQLILTYPNYGVPPPIDPDLRLSNQNLEEDNSKELLSNKFKIYPNPNNGQFVIDLDNNENVMISIYNIQGQQIHSNLNASGKVNLNLSRYPQGIYFVKIVSGNNAIVERIIKE